jgi:integrase
MKGLRREKLTKSLIDSLSTPTPEIGPIVCWDTEITGFGLRLYPSGKKVFIYRRRVNGRQESATIGDYGVWTPDMARKEAREIAVKYDKGVSVNAEKRAARARGATLDDMFTDYLESHDLRPNSVKTYKGNLKNHLSDWGRTPIKDIDASMVVSRYKKICKESGTSPANQTMRFFRAVYSFAEGLGDASFPRNPVKALKGVWRDVGKRRQTIVKDADLPTWYEAVQGLENSLMRDYFELLLYTGMRREEPLKMEWASVDMNARTFTVPIGKAKNKRANTRYMSRQVYAIFKRRFDNKENGYVFPGDGEAGHFRDPNKQISIVIEKSGVTFCPNDIRRTFITIASYTVPESLVKYMVNHATTDNNVTAGYIILSAEKKMDAEQKMSDAIDRLIAPQPEGNVIPIGASKKGRKAATK